MFFFTACPTAEQVFDPAYAYNIKINISNESSSDKVVKVTSYTVHKDEKDVLQLEEFDSVNVTTKTKGNINVIVSDAICEVPILSHNIKIADKNFTGFDASQFKLYDTDSNTETNFTAVKSNLGIVDWTDGSNKSCVIKYLDKEIAVPENTKKIWLIYDIVIKNESDISVEENRDFSEGIKITVSHTFE